MVLQTTRGLTFTRPLSGFIQIDPEHRILLPRRSPQTVVLPDLRVVGAKLNEGSLGVASDKFVTITARTSAGLDARKEEDLPKAVRLRTSRPIDFGFAYSHVPWRLELEITSR